MQSSSPCDDLSEFRSSFFEECSGMLLSIEDRLAGAQGRVPDLEGLNDIFRAAHTIKGLAGFFGFDAVVGFAHTFETLLVALRENRIEQTADTGVLLVEAADALATLIEQSRDNGDGACEATADICARIQEALARGPETAAAATAAEAPSDASGTTVERSFDIRFRVLGRPESRQGATEAVLSELRRLGTIALAAGESGRPASSGEPNADGAVAVTLISAASEEAIREIFEFVDCELDIATAVRPESPGDGDNAEAPPAPAGPAAGSTRSPRAEPQSAGGGQSLTSIRVELARVDRLVNMVGELVISQAMLAQQMTEQNGGSRQALRQSHEDLAAHMRELQECVMAIRMQPVRSVFSRIPRLVREISSKLGKKVRLVVSGEQTEIDKTVIEELGDPLLHMVRNAIDHGIETAEARRAAGKPEEGLIELSAAQRGGSILISLSDDGAGIDRQRVRQKAIERGIIPADVQISGEELDQLIFAPGFSTASAVTDVSGRGVGMDVVLSKINNIGGRIHIQSVLGRGTKFTLVLPLTLAVLDGMVVSAARETYILPLTNIVETIRPAQRDVRQLANGSVVVSIRGEYIRLVSLGDALGLAGAIQQPWNALVVVVELDNGSKFGLVVDELLGQRQVVVKSLAENFGAVEGVSGATILGTGRVALILDVDQLARFGVRRASRLASGILEPHPLHAALNAGAPQDATGAPAPLVSHSLSD